MIDSKSCWFMLQCKKWHSAAWFAKFVKQKILHNVINCAEEQLEKSLKSEIRLCCFCTFAGLVAIV